MRRLRSSQNNRPPAARIAIPPPTPTPAPTATVFMDSSSAVDVGVDVIAWVVGVVVARTATVVLKAEVVVDDLSALMVADAVLDEDDDRLPSSDG